MEEQKMVDAFRVLRTNMPRAPEALVESMVRKARAVEAKRQAMKAQEPPARSRTRSRAKEQSARADPMRPGKPMGMK